MVEIGSFDHDVAVEEIQGIILAARTPGVIVETTMPEECGPVLCYWQADYCPDWYDTWSVVAGATHEVAAALNHLGETVQDLHNPPSDIGNGEWDLAFDLACLVGVGTLTTGDLWDAYGVLSTLVEWARENGMEI